jgi:hypothetical protein
MVLQTATRGRKKVPAVKLPKELIRLHFQR